MTKGYTNSCCITGKMKLLSTGWAKETPAGYRARCSVSLHKHPHRMDAKKLGQDSSTQPRNIRQLGGSLWKEERERQRCWTTE